MVYNHLFHGPCAIAALSLLFTGRLASSGDHARSRLSACGLWGVNSLQTL